MSVRSGEATTSYIIHAPLGEMASSIQADYVRFPDGEVKLDLHHLPRRGAKVAVAWCMNPIDRDPNGSLLALLQLLDLLRRAGVCEIRLFLPYLSYQRQDRQLRDTDPLTGELVIRLLLAAGASSLLCLDPHVEAALLKRPHVQTISADLALARVAAALSPDLVVSPDEGGRARAARTGSELGIPHVVARKRHVGSETEIDGIRPTSVAGRRVLIRDDLASTGSTLKPMVRQLSQMGASVCGVAVTHLLCDRDALGRTLGTEVLSTNSCGQAGASVDVLELLRLEVRSG